jgi:hypothetical protein
MTWELGTDCQVDWMFDRATVLYSKMKERFMRGELDENRKYIVKQLVGQWKARAWEK